MNFRLIACYTKQFTDVLIGYNQKDIVYICIFNRRRKFDLNYTYTATSYYSC